MQLNHSSPTPLYYQLRQMIRNNIVDGVWQDGMMLPSETQLATELKLSRQTVKQAYDGLVQEGLVSRKRGKGTYVTYRQAEFNIMQEPNFYQQMDDERAVQLAKRRMRTLPSGCGCRLAMMLPVSSASVTLMTLQA